MSDSATTALDGTLCVIVKSSIRCKVCGQSHHTMIHPRGRQFQTKLMPITPSLAITDQYTATEVHCSLQLWLTSATLMVLTLLTNLTSSNSFDKRQAVRPGFFKLLSAPHSSRSTHHLVCESESTHRLRPERPRPRSFCVHRGRRPRHHPRAYSLYYLRRRRCYYYKI
ncbi:unnamed protein product [Trichogramma brassicae]|uniref:Uncharacterized protein n=1 Tax=Trichogramma brassicae TaxID=86971 RepID=A0A6H5HV94_9HYME|nr:unnamed protein product [Trichogramma brassicae]